MQKNLFLLCPTDCLEAVIDRAFEHENYFYTSLGNSLNLDSEDNTNIEEWIKKQQINTIYLILAYDNRIVLDGLGSQFYSDIRGMEQTYHELRLQKRQSDLWLHTSSSRFMTLSYYLNTKIKALEGLLSALSYHSILIEAKIYNRYEGRFQDIYNELICRPKTAFN